MSKQQKSSRGRQTENSKFKKTNSKKQTKTSKKDVKFGNKKDKNYRINPNTIKNFKKKPSSDTNKVIIKKGIRLNKYIANAGICSRREADVYIAAGNATVNGKIITEMGYQVMPNDIVRFDGQSLTPETKQYVLLNKPKNYITTMDDERGRKTVMDLVASATKERIYPVGRLDRATTGLLLFTNDGELTKKLTHPKHNVRKLYHATLDKKLQMKDLQSIAVNFILEGKMVFVDKISYVDGKPKTEIGIEIHSGRNRIVRKIFAHFGYKVVKLDRVIFAGLTKKNLPRGFHRPLTKQELNYLKMI
ncbi:MAG: rRNA pseudouridine synthase [Flavobacteriaceae bacterium]|nr:rRNA pseudouridine synthase [Flavobacteriaceae bacterium]